MSESIHIYETCGISGCEDTFGKYGIKPIKAGGNYFIWWFDKGDPDISRKSLFTRDFQTARRKMIAWSEGLQEDCLGGNPLFITILTDYLKTLPKVHQHRCVASMLSVTLIKHAPKTRFSHLYEGRQKLWMESLRDEGYAAKSIAACMSLISSVVRWATTADENGLRKCRPLREKIIVSEHKICKLIGMPKGKPVNWHPEPEGMVRLIIALQNEPAVLRWLLLMLTFGCRVQAACQASSDQLRWSQFDLLVPNTAQKENKWRPELPVAPSALKEFQSWGEGTWVGLSDKKVGEVFREVRVGLEMPKLLPSSIRDYVATMLRHAHNDFGVRYIHKEEQERWQGHLKDDIHGRYGKYRPDYMIRSLVATEAMLRDLDHRSGGGLFRHASDTTDLNTLAEQEDVEISPKLVVKDLTEVHREAAVFIGPEWLKKGDCRPLQGGFRQISDNKVRRSDGVIDVWATLFTPSLGDRLAASGISVFEEMRSDRADATTDAAIYLVANGSNVIPRVRAGTLASQHEVTPQEIRVSKHVDINDVSLGELEAEFRRLEAEISLEYDQNIFDGNIYYAEESFRRQAKRAALHTKFDSGSTKYCLLDDVEVDHRLGEIVKKMNHAKQLPGKKLG